MHRAQVLQPKLQGMAACLSELAASQAAALASSGAAASALDAALRPFSARLMAIAAAVQQLAANQRRFLLGAGPAAHPPPEPGARFPSPRVFAALLGPPRTRRQSRVRAACCVLRTAQLCASAGAGHHRSLPPAEAGKRNCGQLWPLLVPAWPCLCRACQREHGRGG